MSAQALLTKAVEYDAGGRRLEALKLYEDGILQLLNMCKSESDPQKKLHFQVKIKEYIERAELIKTTIQKASSLGEIVDRIHIMEGSTGYSYERIFGKYLNDETKEIVLEEPYLREHHQLSNLVMFLELVVKKCRNIKFLKITTTKDPRSNSTEQAKALTSLRKNITDRNIQFHVEYSDSMHDRQIILSSGYIIKIGRGLHFFKPTNGRYILGYTDFDFRECRETNVDVFKCQQ